MSALAAHNVLMDALDDLERELRCPICLDWLDNPRQLDVCKHLFCSACLERAFSNGDVARRGCPVCSTPATRRSAVTDSFTAALVVAAKSTCDGLRAGRVLELSHPPPPPPPKVPSAASSDRQRYVEQAAAHLSDGGETPYQPMQLEEIMHLNDQIVAKAEAIEQMNASLTHRAQQLASAEAARARAHVVPAVAERAGRPVRQAADAAVAARLQAEDSLATRGGAAGARHRSASETAGATERASVPPVLASSSTPRPIPATGDRAAESDGDGAGDIEEEGGCSICGADEADEENPIILCDGCDLAVHLGCYGIDSMASLPEGDWMCDTCVARRLGSGSRKAPASLVCPLCPLASGAFKRTYQGEDGGWAHVSCVLFHKGPGFLEGPGARGFQNAAGLRNLSKDLWEKLHCTLCADEESARSGAKLQCAYGKCQVAFHPTCAIEAGALTEQHDSGWKVYCGKHSELLRERERLRAAPRPTSSPAPLATPASESAASNRSLHKGKLPARDGGGGSQQATVGSKRTSWPPSSGSRRSERNSQRRRSS